MCADSVYEIKIHRVVTYLAFQTGCQQQSPLYLLRLHLLWLLEVKENPQVSTDWMENYC